MTNAKKLQAALKRKVILRETLRGTNGYKAKSVSVVRIDSRWYGFTIDGSYFECKWNWGYKSPTLFYFRANKELQNNRIYGAEYGCEEDKVKYASSLYFGNGSDIIPCLWLVGEVLSKKSSYDFSKDDEDYVSK